MKKSLTLILLIAGLFFISFQPENAPRATISNKHLKAVLTLPDTVDGYYMGTRFDWSGVIESLVFEGHNYFGRWFDKYDPLIHDAIMGPVEEFSPLNYNETEPGGNFIKPGVGILKKPVEPRYDKFSLYQIINHGKWKITRKKDSVIFTQELVYGNFGYTYTKTVRLLKGKPVLELSHSLKNTGKMAIKTDVYDHNFFVIDNQPTGPFMSVNFPYNVTGTGQGIGTLALINSKNITFSREFAKGETIFCGSVDGFRKIPEDFDIKILNSKTGAGVRITSDTPLLKLVFWACATTLSPETYLDINVEPGQEFRWRFNYEFYLSK